MVRVRPLVLAAALPVATQLAPDARAQARSVDARRADSAAVHAAVDDDVGALYDVAPDRVRRSVSPALANYGYAADAAGCYAGMVMTDDELVALAGRDNRAGPVSPSAPRAVTAFDVQDQTASAKRTAHWRTDSLLLARQDGAWRVTHVLWQPRPHGAARAAAAAGR